MKIFLGTESKDKKKILDDSLKDLGVKNYSIKAFNVKSKVLKQPLTEKMTIRGARNRAFESLKKSKEEGVGIGLEAGLVKISKESNYYLVCVCFIVDSFKKESVGISSKLSLPLKVSDKVKKGEEFGVCIRNFSYKKSKLNCFYVKQLISRELLFKEAISNAFLNYFFKS